jgi:hypothetical protein
MTEKTFAELYCEQHGVEKADYDRVVLNQSLYPHARLLAPLIRFFWSDYFAADLDFVRSVGRLRRFREFFYEAEEFAHHPANRGFWRLTANVRVSSRALRRMVRSTLHSESEPTGEAEDQTAVPFGGSVQEKTPESASPSRQTSRGA